MAAAARTPNMKVVETAPGVTVRYARLVQLVKAMRTVVVPIAVGGGRIVKVAGDDVLPTPAAPKEQVKPKGAGAKKKHWSEDLRPEQRVPGSDNHVARQQDLFLTCGDPEGTLPCRCPFDRAHSNKSGAHFTSAAIDGPTPKGGGGRVVRKESTARRYPPSLLNHRGYSIDAAADDLHERQRFLADLGVAGFGGAGSDDDSRRGVAVYDRFFAGRERQSVRASLRKYGLSSSLAPVGGKGDA